MSGEPYNILVVLGPTASGKTRLGARLADALGGEIVSADSRQVYRGLDIGAGKDLAEYTVEGRRVPYHLIDIVDLDAEFSVFEYQKRCFQTLAALGLRGVLPVLVGGTGLYIDAVLEGYRMVETPEDPDLRAELAQAPHPELVERLHRARPYVHNVTDLEDRDRLVRAIEIAEHADRQPPEPAPELHPLILGTRWDRPELVRRIRERLKQRLDAGMIQEVETLAADGVPWSKLAFLGLEYRYVAQYLQGTIKNRNDLFQKLFAAICRFAKRQQTWFRRMERRGMTIHWIDRADYERAAEVVARHRQAAT